MIGVRALLERLWEDYANLNAQARRIHALLRSHGERVVNDHVALRTFDDGRVGIDRLARAFVEAGYRPGGDYTFREKKLFARHYEPAEADLPLLFVSELRLQECSAALRRRVAALLDQLPAGFSDRDDFAVAGRPWSLAIADHEAIAAESEYAGWLAAFGFRANHFTVRVNELTTFAGIRELNEFLKSNGFALNAAGGEVKGSPEALLEQSSTLAEDVEVAFADGVRRLPGAYYEFAKRHPLPGGGLFLGFVEKSADRIFESTDRHRKEAS